MNAQLIMNLSFIKVHSLFHNNCNIIVYMNRTKDQTLHQVTVHPPSYCVFKMIIIFEKISCEIFKRTNITHSLPSIDYFDVVHKCVARF